MVGATKINSAFHPLGLLNLVPACEAGVKVGHIDLCQVAGMIHIAGDSLQLWDGLFCEELYRLCL